MPKLSDTAAISLFFKQNGASIEDWQKKNLIHGQHSRQKPLFKDPIMPILWREISQDKKVVEFAQQLDGLNPLIGNAMAVRHRYFNRALSRAVKDARMPTEQSLFLGGGYDTRPVRKAKYPVQYFEVDQPEVLNNKHYYYQKNNIKSNSIVLELDYVKEDLMGALQKNGFSVGRTTHIILEGNVVYYPIEEVKRIFRVFAQNMRAAFSVSFDFYREEVRQETSPETLIGKMNAKAMAFSKGFRSSITDLGRFADEMGYEVYDCFSLSELITQYGIDSQPDPYLGNYAMCTLKCFPVLKYSYLPQAKVTYKTIETDEEYEQYVKARSVVYFHSNGVHMPKDENDKYHHLLVAKVGDEIVGGARYVISTPFHPVKLPLEYHFDVKNVKLGLKDKAYCEWGRTFVKSKYAGSMTEIILNLMAIANEICLKFGCTDLMGLSPVRVGEHYKMMARQLGFEYVMTGDEVFVTKDKGGQVKLVLAHGLLGSNLKCQLNKNFQAVTVPGVQPRARL